MADVPQIYRETIAGYDPWRDAGECRFDHDAARKAVRFFPDHLRHVKGEWAGQPFKLERWQRQFVGHVFGWKRPDGTRRFRKVFLYVPRKNGKTAIGGGLVLVCFFLDAEPGAEVYSAAADRNQAGLIYEHVKGMILQAPELSDLCHVYKGYKSVELLADSSIYRVLSSEADTKHGMSPHCYVVDEVHLQRKPDLMDVFETGTGARRQPLGIFLTTADFARPSPCNELLDYARRVRDGIIIDPEFFPVLYEASRDDDWKDEKLWRRVNPCYGVSLKRDYMKARYRRALNEPSFENTFKRLHLNIQTEQQQRWLPMSEWLTCPAIEDRAALAGLRCYGGLDLSSTTDITTFVLYFPEVHSVLAWFWVPQAMVDKRIEYEPWVAQGWLDVTPGNVVDYEYIRSRVNESAEAYKLQDVGYDPWNASQVVIELADHDGLPMVEFRQGFISMNAPAKELEKIILEHALRHGENPVLTWMASNVAVKEDPSGNIRPVKPGKNSPLKVDGIVALIMAIGRSMAGDQVKESVYETRGPIVL